MVASVRSFIRNGRRTEAAFTPSTFPARMLVTVLNADNTKMMKARSPEARFPSNGEAVVRG